MFVPFQVGGFQLPFFAIGCSMFAAIPVLFCVLPSDCGDDSGKTPDQEKFSFPIVEALKIPAVMMVGEYIHPLFSIVIKRHFPLVI